MSAFIAHGIDAIAVATEAAGLLSSALTVVDVGGPERSAARYGSSLQASALQLRRVLPTASPLSLLEAVPA